MHRLCVATILAMSDSVVSMALGRLIFTTDAKTGGGAAVVVGAFVVVVGRGVVVGGGGVVGGGL
jgi:hypothetical protein